MTSFGAYLKSQRGANQLTQKDIADKLKVAGSYISQIETDMRFPSERQLDDFARAYQVPLEELKKRWLETKMQRVTKQVGMKTDYKFDISEVPKMNKIREAEEKLSKALQEVRSILGDSTRAESNFIQIPILGSAPAGDILEVYPVSDDYIALPQSAIIKSHRFFALRADGVSMEEEGIVSGDICVFDQDEPPQNGDIVLAATPDGVTMKFYHKRKDHIELRPSSKTFKKIYRLKEVVIQGKLVYHIKKY